MNKVKTDTIIRTIVLVLALVNQVLVMLGKGVIPITDEQVEALVSIVFTIAASLWAWWKNNSFTQPAIKADVYLDELRREK